MQQVVLIEKAIVIKATPAKLFKALTDARELTKWFCDRAESDPHQGGRVVHAWGDHEGHGIYKRLVPNQEVAIEWESHDHDLIEDLTIYRLEKTPQGTRVTVLDFALPDELEDLNKGWEFQLKQLKQLYQAKPATKKAAPSKKATPKRKAAPKAKPQAATASRKRAKK